MWLLEQGACHAMHCDSVHSALITGYKNTAHSFGDKMLRKLGRGSPRFAQHDNRETEPGLPVLLFMHFVELFES